MSSRRTISNTFTVTTMDDPVSVQAQYSPDKVTVHTTWQNGDLYMRTRESDDVAWSSWHKIVGESGDETDYTFNISKSLTSTNATTAPANCYYNTWQDAPIAPTSTYPYLWMKVVKKTWNESTQSYDSGTPSYARITGEPGTSPYFADLNNEMDAIKCKHDGGVIADQTVSTVISMWKGSAVEAFVIDNIYRNGTQLTWDGNNSGVWPRISGSTVSVEFDTSASIADIDDFKITIHSYNDNTVTRELHFTINGVRSNAIYRLVPSHSQIVKKKNNTYEPSGNITCSVEKTEDGATSTPSSGEYTLEKSVNGGSYTAYSATAASSITSDLKFRLTVGGVVVDLETIPLVSDGDKGNEGKGYKAVVTRNNFTESNWATYGELGHPEWWSNTSSTRGNCKTGDWFIVVGTATDTKNYHIATYECSNDRGDLAGTCINHQITKDGVSYCFVFTKAAARVDENNTVTAELAGYAYKYVGGVRSALASTTIRYGYILTDSDTYVDTTTNSSGFFDAGTWFNGDDITNRGKNSPSIFAAIVIGGTVVHAEMITISVKGSTGNRGKVGRFFYFAGTFNPQDNDQTHVFVVNDAQAPYFEHTETVTTQSGTTTIKRYHVFDYETNGSYTMAQMWSISNQSWSNTPWEVMTNDFKYLITEAIFSNFAKLASAIFSGDWMLSQYGVPSRVISTEEKRLVYLCVKVDGQYPVSDLATLLDDADLWDEYKGYGYSDSELETVADICKWAVSAMPSNSDDIRYNAIQTISTTSYQLFGLNPSNLFSVFEPNISFDFLRGKAYLNDCNVKGNLTGRVSTPFTRIKNSSDWDGYGVKTTDDYGYTRHYLFINEMPTWNVQIEYMSGSTEVIRRLILPVITPETLGVEIKIVNVSGDTITVEGKPEKSTYMSYGSYLLDGIQTTGYSNDQRTIEMDNQTMLKFVSVEIPTQHGEYGWIAIGEPQTIKSLV